MFYAAEPWLASVSARIHAKQSSATSCWSFKGSHVLILSQTSLVRYSGGLLLVQSVYIVSTWFVPRFVASFVMGFRNWRWPLPCRILLDPWKNCVRPTKTGSPWLKSTTNWEAQRVQRRFTAVLLFFNVRPFHSLSCFRGRLNFLVSSYLLGTGGRRRDRREWFQWAVSFLRFDL